MEKETCTFSYCEKPEIVEIDTDILIVGGGMSAFTTGAGAGPGFGCVILATV